MPLYEYECTACHAHEEHEQKMSDPPVEKCAKCGGKLERVISRTSFVLKGGGWYKDGYGSGGKSGSGG